MPERIRNSGRSKRIKTNNGSFGFRYSMSHKLKDATLPNIEFILENNLGLNSHPAEWFDPWLPLNRKNNTHPKVVTMEDLTTWTNTKAMLCNAGVGGGMYKDFKPFTIAETRAQLAVYLLQGLSPSPQLEMKFLSQDEDPVNGSNLCHKVFGSRGVTRMKEFKCFFAAVNPLIPIPDVNKHPNHKVDPIFHHMMHISKKAIILGKNISVDEMDISFQGQHRDKQRINYKRAGDGFLVDALCSGGYCFSFYFRNQPPPKKWMAKKMSPLHSRVLSLFEQLPLHTKNYDCKMDNLFMSAKFAKVALTQVPAKVMIHGVTRLNQRGFPKCVIQKQLSSKKDVQNARGTLKVAKMVGDPKCEMVAVSLYDQKPVYLLSTSCPTVEWRRKTRKLYHKALNKKVEVPFYRLNVIDDYNMHMNNVDVADQLRLQYRIHNWIRNRKWWWAMFFWSFETSITNYFILYKKIHLLHNREPISHYEFLRLITLSWLDPENYSAKKWKQINEKKNIHNISTQTSLSSDSISNRSSARKKVEAEDNRGATRLTVCSVHPYDGSLKMRLDRKLPHFPKRQDNINCRCQLHGFLKMNRSRAKVMYCKDCNVNLCIDCWQTFHTCKVLKRTF